MKAPQLFIQFAQLFMICTGLAEESMTAEEMRKRIISGKIPEAEKEAILERLLQLERTGSSKKSLGFKCELLNGKDFDMVSGPLGIYAHTMFMHGLIEFFNERTDVDIPELPVVDIRIVKSRLNALFSIEKSEEDEVAPDQLESIRRMYEDTVSKIIRRRYSTKRWPRSNFDIIVRTCKQFKKAGKTYGLFEACYSNIIMTPLSIAAKPDNNFKNTLRGVIKDLKVFIENDAFIV